MGGAPVAVPSEARLVRPVFLVAAPRAGAGLVFEMLSLSPDVWTVGGESHGLVEGVDGLGPAGRGYESHRLGATDAREEVVKPMERALLGALRNRHGNGLPGFAGAVRMVERTPRNALRIPFLAAAFPDAQFIYIYRRPEPNIASLMEAWQSGRFVSLAELPGWEGPPWSMVLIPGWRELVGRGVAEIAVRQWMATNATILEDLAGLPDNRWCAVAFEDVVARPMEFAQRLSDFAHVSWDINLATPLPSSRNTLSPPDPEKWRKHEAEIAGWVPEAQALHGRAVEAASTHGPPAHQPQSHLASQPPTVIPQRAANLTAADSSQGGYQVPQAPVAASGAAVPAGDARGMNFSSEHTTSFPKVLEAFRISLAISTYQSGKLIFARSRGGVLNTHFRDFMSPMGLAYHEGLFAVGAKNDLWKFRNFSQLGPKADAQFPCDAVFLPAVGYVTGDIRIHEIAFGANHELWAVNTRFSCLCTFDGYHNFVPRWRPPFVSAVTAEDRCHLNGMAMRDGVPAYVTCHAPTDTPEGWRGHKLDGGCIVNVATGEFTARGLCMPHSPRLHGGKLWFLESGHGRLCCMDPAGGPVTTVAELPGFTRGLELHDRYAFIGLSQVRESAVFSGVPISEPGRERKCGVWVVDTSEGKIVAFLHFSGTVQEIFALQVLPFVNPDLVADNGDMISGAFFVPG